MSQQINLFNPAFTPRRDFASARYAAAGGVLVLVLAITGSLAAQSRQSALAAQERTLAAQLSAARAQAEALSARLGARQVDPGVMEQLKAAQALIASRQRVMQWLNTEHLDNTGGVSEYFRALARQTVNGVWLTGFHVGGNGKTLRIEGRTLRGDLVPAYLGKLGTEDSLKGHAFAVVALEEVPRGAAEKIPAYLSFKLETAGPEPVAKP
jgi:hypothetical protein